MTRGNRDPLDIRHLIQCLHCGEFFEFDDYSCQCKRRGALKYVAIKKSGVDTEPTAIAYGLKAERSQILKSLTRDRRVQKLKTGKRRESAMVRHAEQSVGFNPTA